MYFLLPEIMCESGCHLCFKDLNGYPLDHVMLMLRFFKWDFLGMYDDHERMLIQFSRSQTPPNWETIVVGSKDGIVIHMSTIEEYLLEPNLSLESYHLYAYNMQPTF